MELVDDNPAGWCPGTRIYRTSSGHCYAVEAPNVPEGQAIPVGVSPMIEELLVKIGAGRAALKAVVRPTVIIPCNDDGSADDLAPTHTFPAGTTHEDALQRAGYTV